MEEYYKKQREEVRELVDEIIELVIKKMDLSNKDYLIDHLKTELEKMYKIVKRI